jgi:PST family polysaccharide transporter
LEKFIKKISNSELVNISIFTGLATGIKLITALITAKIIAIYLGPTGLGVLGQLNSFVAIVMVLSTGAVTNGVIKYLSEYVGNKAAQMRIIKAAAIITTICSTVVSLVIILFNEYWSKILFKENSFQYNSIIVIFGFTLFFYASFTLFTAILNGLKYFKKFNYLGIITSLVGLLFSVLLIIKLGVYGALLAAITYQSLVFVFVFIFKNRIAELSILELKKIKTEKRDYINLFKFSTMALVSSILLPISQIIIRNMITKELDITIMGFYEGINRLSNIYLTLITTTLSVYYLPKLSELNDKVKLRKEILNGYKLILPVTIIILLVVYFLRNFIIQIAFAVSFNQMESFFAPQLIGDFFKIASWLLAFLMLAKAMIKLYIITEVIFSILIIVLTFFGIDLFGSVGAIYAYAINYFIYFIAMLIIFNKTIYDRGK